MKNSRSRARTSGISKVEEELEVEEGGCGDAEGTEEGPGVEDEAPPEEDEGPADELAEAEEAPADEGVEDDDEEEPLLRTF